MVGEETQVRLHPLVISFRLSVHPWVVCGRDVLLYPQGATQFLNEFSGEPGVSVAYDFMRESISPDNGIKKQTCRSFSCDGFNARYEVHHLGATVISDGEY